MKRKKLWSYILAGMLLVATILAGCGGETDPKQKSYKTKEEAIEQVTRDDQEFVTEIEAREGKVIVVWSNIADDARVPFSLGLLESDGENWKLKSTDSVTMTDKFSGDGLYPVKEGLISYAVSPSEDDPVRDSYADHISANDWAFHWTIVPELPA